jgi:membrane-bound metal-dependent hydrolase YbcI (DUF457 family)
VGENVLFEHILYSTAIAIIAGMIYSRRTGRDPSWIIVLCAYVPDLDIIADAAFKKIGITVLIYGNPIEHGNFHNIIMLLLFAFSAALLLQMGGIRPIDSFIFAGIGFGAHLFEDVLVFNPGYSFFWPVSSQKFGIGIVEYESDLFGIANSEILAFGLISLILSASFRIWYERNRIKKKLLV